MPDTLEIRGHVYAEIVAILPPNKHGQEVVRAVIPSWNPYRNESDNEPIVHIAKKNFPRDIWKRLQVGTAFFVEINKAAIEPGALHPDKFELTTSIESQDLALIRKHLNSPSEEMH